MASPADEYLGDRKKTAFTTSFLHIAKNIFFHHSGWPMKQHKDMNSVRFVFEFPRTSMRNTSTALNFYEENTHAPNKFKKFVNKYFQHLSLKIFFSVNDNI